MRFFTNKLGYPATTKAPVKPLKSNGMEQPSMIRRSILGKIVTSLFRTSP